MAVQVVTWLFAFPMLGFATGLRTMTPIAALCWFAHFQLLPLDGTWGLWAASLVSAIIFTGLALGELVADKLPRTPDRTDAGPLIARLVFGGLVSALAATALQGSVLEGVILGVLGAAAGTFGGFMFRRFFAHHHGQDFPVALGEDGVTLLLTVLALHMISNLA